MGLVAVWLCVRHRVYGAADGAVEGEEEMNFNSWFLKNWPRVAPFVMLGGVMALLVWVMAVVWMAVGGEG